MKKIIFGLLALSISSNLFAKTQLQVCSEVLIEWEYDKKHIPSICKCHEKLLNQSFSPIQITNMVDLVGSDELRTVFSYEEVELIVSYAMLLGVSSMDGCNVLKVK